MTRKYSNSKRPLLLKRQQIIEHWLELKSQGVDERTLQEVLKISRTTWPKSPPIRALWLVKLPAQNWHRLK